MYPNFVKLTKLRDRIDVKYLFCSFLLFVISIIVLLLWAIWEPLTFFGWILSTCYLKIKHMGETDADSSTNIFSLNRPTGRIRSSSRIVFVCVCLCVCLSPFHKVDFEAYFSPTSRSWGSKIFRNSESLGKSAGKKWSQNWTFLLGSGLKLPRKKKFFFADFALQNMVETTLPDGLETSGWRVYR